MRSIHYARVHVVGDPEYIRERDALHTHARVYKRRERWHRTSADTQLDYMHMYPAHIFMYNQLLQMDGIPMPDYIRE